jgi:hypothetical protein
MSAYSENRFNTTHLTLNVMANAARRLDLDIEDDKVADTLYWICCDLESWPEDCGFGSSDHYSYVQQARKEFDIPEECDKCVEPAHRCEHGLCSGCCGCDGAAEAMFEGDR